MTISLPVRAEHAADPQVVIPLFLKILTYDDNFRQDELRAINLIVVYDRDVVQSYREFSQINEYLKDHPNLVVSGVILTHVAMSLESFDTLSPPDDPDDYNILLVTSVGRDKIKHLSERTRKYKMRSFSLQPDYVQRGLAVGVDPQRKSKTILVNREAALQEGSKFSAHLLKMCEIF